MLRQLHKVNKLIRSHVQKIGGSNTNQQAASFTVGNSQTIQVLGTTCA